MDGFFRFEPIGGDQNVTCDLDHVFPLHRHEFGKPNNLFLARHRFKRQCRLGSNGHEPSDELKRVHVLEGPQSLGRVHEDRLTKDVAHRERSFDLLAGQGTDEVQREGCGQRVGDDLRFTVVTDEDRRSALLVGWPVVRRCRHHPSMHLTYDQLHSSEPAKDKKHKHFEAEATCPKPWTQQRYLNVINTRRQIDAMTGEKHRQEKIKIGNHTLATTKQMVRALVVDTGH